MDPPTWGPTLRGVGVDGPAAVELAGWLTDQGWDSPETLRGLTQQEVRDALAGAPEGGAETVLRAVQARPAAPRPGGADEERPTELPKCAWALANRVQTFPTWKTAAERKCRKAGLAGSVDRTQGPRAVCRTLAVAGRRGAPTNEALDLRVQLTALQSVEKSLPQVASGLRCWAAFCDATGTRHFPAGETAVLRHTGIFRCGQTMANYLGRLKLAHKLLREPINFDTPEVRLAGRGIAKTWAPEAKERLAIRSPLATKLVRLALAEKDEETAVAMAWAYAYLLRVGDECIPLRAAPGSEAAVFEHSKVATAGTTLRVVLKTRKNRPRGSVIERTCSCAKNKWLCPRHVGERLLQRTPAGERLFPSLTYRRFTRSLRRYLAMAQVPGVDGYGSHAFRRGAAQDVWESSRSVAAVLAAGEWSSKGFLRYLKADVIDEDMVVRAICDAEPDDAEQPR